MKLTQFLSPFQVVQLSSASFFPLTFWIFPRIAVQYAGLDAQWAVLGAILVGLFTGWVNGLLNERFPSMTGPDFLTMAWGKWLGKLMSAFYVPVYIVFCGLCIYFFTLALKPFFPNTPRIAFVLVLCLVAVRGAWMGIESLGRVASIVHPVTLFGVVFVFMFIFLQADRFWFPSVVTSLPTTARGVYHLFPLFLGFSLALMLSPYYEHKQGKSVWYPVISAASGGIAIAVAFMAVAVNLGVLPAQKLTFAVPFVLQLVRMHGWIVERMGILIIIFATAHTVLFVSCHFWKLSVLTARILNLRDDKYKRFVLPVAICVTAGGLWFRSDEQAFELLDRYLVPVSWVVLVIVPLSTLIMAWARGIRTKPRPIVRDNGENQSRG